MMMDQLMCESCRCTWTVWWGCEDFSRVPPLLARISSHIFANLPLPSQSQSLTDNLPRSLCRLSFCEYSSALGSTTITMSSA